MKQILFLLLMLVFSGCNQPQPASQTTKPLWITNPNQSGKIGAVGVANIHYKGFTYQRKLAISRALDEMALQQGVEVVLDMKKSEKVANDRLSSDMKVKSSYETQKKDVKAHIKATWQDPISQEFYVWLVIN